MSESKWKNHLLSTGVPLEHSVRKTLRSSGYLETPQYEFAQRDENGVMITRSIDIHAEVSHKHKNGLSRFEYLIECKYAAPHRKWLFFPDETAKGDSLSDTLNLFDDLSGNTWFGRIQVKAEDPVPASENGVVVSDDSATKSDIRTGIYQLKYASMHRAAEIISSQVTWLKFAPDSPVALVPILVTSASLLRVKPSVDIDVILGAKNLDEIAEECSAVVVRAPSSIREQEYLREQLQRRLDSEEIEYLQSHSSVRGGLPPLMLEYQHKIARSIVVVNLDRFRRLAAAHAKYFESMDLKRRSDGEPPAIAFAE